tara:strand:+ start:499 stop:639 length:141 start_codon:yes stop_codon:yes gene_type:complete
MNGKGDRWRGGWNKVYEDNFNSIFNMPKQSKKYKRKSTKTTTRKKY